MRRFWKIIRDTEAATAVEYGLVVALLVIAVIAGIGNFATATTDMWNVVSNNVEKNT
jgi:pilus assembly protein Flp/PilA